MDLLKQILNSYGSVIKNLSTSISFWIFLILTILLKIFYPKFRGFMGEFWVKEELSKLSKKKYIVLNNIMLKQGDTTHQIDHIVVSEYGIFVIEMKNYIGMIHGDDKNANWVQYLGKRKCYFQNPIHQNYGHVKVLEEVLSMDNKKFIPIVCFSNQAKIKVKSNNSVVQLDNLVGLIKNFTISQINNIEQIANTISKQNITDKDLRRGHVKSIKAKIQNNEEKANNMICPQCGGKLVQRNGKYGTFVGCSNYPKCRYIKK